MAGIMGYKRRKVFEIPDVERKGPDARDLFGNN
jgi:hypothetical protein